MVVRPLQSVYFYAAFDTQRPQKLIFQDRIHNENTVYAEISTV